MAKPKGIMLYFDIKEPLSDFTDAERGQLIWALLEYGENQTVPQLSGMLKTAFDFIKKDVDRDIEKYNNRCQRNKDNISKRYDRIPSYTNDNDCIPSNVNKDKDKDKDKIKENNNLLSLPQNAHAFYAFWGAYPKKKGKQAAEKAFEKLKPDDELLNIILTALEEQKKSAEWQKDNGQFIPYPATWLNGKRWEDELTATDYQQKISDDVSFDVELAERQAKLQRSSFGRKKTHRHAEQPKGAD